MLLQGREGPVESTRGGLEPMDPSPGEMSWKTFSALSHIPPKMKMFIQRSPDIVLKSTLLSPLGTVKGHHRFKKFPDIPLSAAVCLLPTRPPASLNPGQTGDSDPLTLDCLSQTTVPFHMETATPQLICRPRNKT